MDKYIYHSTNFKLPHNNDVYYNIILKKVSHQLNRSLLKSEIKETVSFIQKLDPDLLKPDVVNRTEKIMITTLANEFSKYKCNNPEYDDSQDYIRKELGLSSESNSAHGIYDNPTYYLDANKNNGPSSSSGSDVRDGMGPSSSSSDLINSSNITLSNLLGLNNAEEAVRVLNPTALLRKNYMVLDTRYRIQSGNTSIVSKFSWTFIQHAQTSIDGSVNLVGNVRDIVAIRVYPFRIPYVKSADNKYARISMAIDELTSQSFIAHENRRFHFMLKSEIDSSYINLKTNKYNDGFFYFEKPITTLNTLTVSFGSPLEPIYFDVDNGWCSIDYFTLAPLTKITTYINNNIGSDLQINNLINGDIVYFSLFKTNPIDPILTDQVNIDNNITQQINRSAGFLVTVIDSSSFTIDLDTSNIQNPVPNIRFNVYYGSKRIFIPIELTYIQPTMNDTK